jgi:hypothetical protein
VITVDSPGQAVEFVAHPGERNRPDIQISRPKRWVTGRPATFHVTVVPRDAALEEVISIEPGRVFDVTWTRPGRFPVTVKVRVRLKTSRDGFRATCVDTYYETVVVDVLALGESG